MRCFWGPYLLHAFATATCSRPYAQLSKLLEMLLEFVPYTDLLMHECNHPYAQNFTLTLTKFGTPCNCWHTMGELEVTSSALNGRAGG